MLIDDGKAFTKKRVKGAKKIAANEFLRFSRNPGGFMDDVLGFGELKAGGEHLKGLWGAFNDTRKSTVLSDAQELTHAKAVKAAKKAGTAVPKAPARRGAWQAIKDVHGEYDYGRALEHGFDWLTAANSGASGWGRFGRGAARGVAALGALKVASWLNPFGD